MARIQTVIDEYPGLVQKDVLTYLKERIKEVLTGAGATIVVRIFGPELDVLRTKAQEVAKEMGKVEGVTSLKVDPNILVPQLDIEVRPEAAARLGLTPGDVRRAASTLIKGTKVGELYQGQKVLDVVIWGAERVRSDVSAIRDLLIETADGPPRSRWATSPTSTSSGPPTTSSARGSRGRSTSSATSPAATSAASPARSRRR